MGRCVKCAVRCPSPPPPPRRLPAPPPQDTRAHATFDSQPRNAVDRPTLAAATAAPSPPRPPLGAGLAQSGDGLVCAGVAAAKRAKAGARRAEVRAQVKTHGSGWESYTRESHFRSQCVLMGHRLQAPKRAICCAAIARATLPPRWRRRARRRALRARLSRWRDVTSAG